MEIERLLKDMMIPVMVTELPYVLTEQNFLQQYVVLGSDGTGKLVRMHLDKSTKSCIDERCRVEYDISGVDQRAGKHLLMFNSARYYCSSGVKVE